MPKPTKNTPTQANQNPRGSDRMAGDAIAADRRLRDHRSGQWLTTAMPLVLGVDSSVAATRVEVRDADTGALVATGQAPHPTVDGPLREQDPASWWSALVDAIARTGQRDIASVAVAGQVGATVITDPAGAVLRPATLADDSRAEATARQLVERFGADTWAGAVGLVPTGSTAVAVLAWLVEDEPRMARRIGHVLGAHGWLTARLSGRVVTDPGEASTTGCFSATARRWRPDVLRRIDGSRSESEWEQRLPDVLAAGARADWMAASVHELVGLRGRPIVAVGTAAPMAAALGLGMRPGQAHLAVDDTGTVTVTSDTPVSDPTGRIVGHADTTGRFLPTTTTIDATGTLAMVARLLGTDEAGLVELATEGVRGNDRVTLVTGTTAALVGLDPDATPAAVARAAHDGVACGLLEGIDVLRAAGATVTESALVLSGPGARSSALRQAVADISGHPVIVPRGERHVARGACVLAAAALAETDPGAVADAWGLGDGPTTEPNHVDREAIRGAHRRQSGKRS